jgi:hypothetical protein
MPEKQQELSTLLDNWLKEIDAAMPAMNPKYDPKRELHGLRWEAKAND